MGWSHVYVSLLHLPVFLSMSSRILSRFPPTSSSPPSQVWRESSSLWLSSSSSPPPWRWSDATTSRSSGTRIICSSSSSPVWSSTEQGKGYCYWSATVSTPGSAIDPVCVRSQGVSWEVSRMKKLTTSPSVKTVLKIGVWFPSALFLRSLEVSQRFVYVWFKISTRLSPENLGRDLVPSAVFQTWMWVIGPMFFYVCERLLRFVRFMQTVHYRKVCWIWNSSSGSFDLSIYRTVTKWTEPWLSDCDETFQSVGAATGEERL